LRKRGRRINRFIGKKACAEKDYCHLRRNTFEVGKSVMGDVQGGGDLGLPRSDRIMTRPASTSSRGLERE